MGLIDRLISVSGKPPLPPGTIYKYCAPIRTEILSRLKLRLTQPGAFNDPFDGYPWTRPFTDEELLSKVTSDPGLSEIWHVALLRLHRDGLLEREWAVADVLQNPVAAGRALWGILSREMEEMHSVVDRRQVGVLSLFDHMLGVVSFSETNDNLLMWGLYAEGHTGFVIGFDASHEFFTSKFGLWPVRYDENRPSMSRDDVWDLRFHLTKARMWCHEREWRFITPILNQLGDSASADGLGYPIVLAELPPSLVRNVIIGARTKEEVRHSITDTLRQTPELSHVQQFRASLDPRAFRVNIKPLDTPRT